MFLNCVLISILVASLLFWFPRCDDSTIQHHSSSGRKLLTMSIEKKSPLIIFSFIGISNTNNYDPIQFFGPYLRNRICYFQKHSIPFALRIVDWSVHRKRFEDVKYMKAMVVQEAMRKFEPEWLFYMDLDLVIADYRRSLTEFIKNDFDLILNDHNAHLNNGAFFIKNTPSMHNFLQNWRDLCERRKLSHVKWGTTDNGAMEEAILQHGGDGKATRCISPSFSFECYQNEFTKRSGVKFDGITDRALSNGVLLSHSVRGFNNHRCKKNIQWQRNWDPRVCFKENESFILHTKQFKSFKHTDKCETTIQFSGKPLYLLFLQESSAPVLVDIETMEIKLF